MKTFKISGKIRFWKHLPKVLSQLSRTKKAPLLLQCPHHGVFRQRFENIYVVWAETLASNTATADFRSRFSEHPVKNSRLLMLADESSSDTVATRILDLGIRDSNRFYAFRVSRPERYQALRELISRLVASLVSPEKKWVRILDARIEGELLVVVSTDFEKIEIPIKDVPPLRLRGFDERVRQIEVDEDGAFIFWPDLDVHLGWEQLKAILDPRSALKAEQKSSDFNRRFGSAIRQLRKRYKLKQSEIPEMSDRQIQRIESGQCRATSRAIKSLAEAHRLSPNEYLEKISSILKSTV